MSIPFESFYAVSYDNNTYITNGQILDFYSIIFEMKNKQDDKIVKVHNFPAQETENHVS